MHPKRSSVTKRLLTAYIDRLILTPEEQEEVKTGARWLRRIANPFIDLYTLATVGTAVSSTIANVSQRPADSNVQDYLKDLYVHIAPMGLRQLTANLS